MRKSIAGLSARRPTDRDFDVADQLFHQKVEWPELIKTLRAVCDANLYDAERLALSHAGWRRWCNWRMDRDPKCRKLAHHHIRLHGQAALIVLNGVFFKVRQNMVEIAAHQQGCEASGHSGLSLPPEASDERT